METCLTDLIGIKSWCEESETLPPLVLENIEGIDKLTLAQVATPSFPSGQIFGEHLIANAASEVAADIEMLIPKAYSIRRLMSNVCSLCTFQPLYNTGQNGIIVKNLNISQFGILNIDKLQILINNTGTFEVTITDGLTPKVFSIDFVAGVMQEVYNINYSTTRSWVKIYFTDFVTVETAAILCSTAGGCGCGVRNASPISEGFQVTGMVAGIESTSQYGFLPCVVMTCSQDAFMCQLINYSKRAFGAAMLYKAASKFFSASRISQRNNRTAGADNDEKESLVTKYDGLYKEIMNGNETRKGIAELINTNLLFINDPCIECNSRVSASYAHG